MTTKAKGNGESVSVSTRIDPEWTIADTAPVAPRAKAPTRIELPKLDIRTVQVRLVGDSALITHQWDEKTKRQMLDKQMKKAKMAKTAKDPFRDFAHSLYWLTPMPDDLTEDNAGEAFASAKFGFPSIGFKAAAVNACSHVDGVTKVEARGAFHINGEWVEIQGDKPTMREDMCRIAMGTADIRYRGEFKSWWCEFVLRYNANVLSLEQIVNLFNTAGFAIGVGEWRPQRNGMFGMFHVAQEGE